MPSSQTDGRAEPRVATFALSRSTQDTRALARSTAAFGIVAALIFLVLPAFGVSDVSQAVTAAATVLVISFGFPLIMRSLRKAAHGEVQVGNDGIALVFRLSRADFPWRDISAARVATTDPSGPYGLMIRLTMAAEKDSVVEVDLRRPYRIGLRSGTDVAGISTGLHKIRFYVDDPQALVTAAKRHLAA